MCCLGIEFNARFSSFQALFRDAIISCGKHTKVVEAEWKNDVNQAKNGMNAWMEIPTLSNGESLEKKKNVAENGTANRQSWQVFSVVFQREIFQ
ncbi:hypothetical protein DUE52_24480 [Larkinella punicea]|uniref:Uncharacterized protein n=1 Tax=Larkinella punicea TaxID=2315727 RepID=A0A368JH19_9BACT|nr:hypothetical protein DUE52_24480 [Larkinella punicea]